MFQNICTKRRQSTPATSQISTVAQKEFDYNLEVMSPECSKPTSKYFSKQIT